jgi:hypothetical protein
MDAYATEATGGGRAISLASLRRFWAMAVSVNSNWAPRGPRNRRRLSRKDTLQVRKQHLDALAIRRAGRPTIIQSRSTCMSYRAMRKSRKKAALRMSGALSRVWKDGFVRCLMHQIEFACGGASLRHWI